MGKNFDEMTIEDFGQLFPIFLVSHNPDWKNWFEQEKEQLIFVLPIDQIIRIEHIGSTVVSTIKAKDIVDILIEVKSRGHLKDIGDSLLKNGWLLMSETTTRLSFNKGYTLKGFEGRIFHLHLRIEGDHDELYFRDYLLKYPEVAKEYEVMKLSLWKKFEHNREAYTEGKARFIKEYTDKARLEFKGRY